MSFGNVIRSAVAPALNPRGIGGDTDTIWSCDIDDLYEINTSDLSVNRTGIPPSTLSNGIGGDVNKIWHCDNFLDDVFELSITDFSTVQSRNAPSTVPSGMGGDANTVWHTDGTNLKILELSSTDLSLIRSGNIPAGSSPGGVGGAVDVIWYCDHLSDDVYELCVSDFSAVQNANSPGTIATGAGGSTSKFWYCDRNTDKYYELDTGAPPTYTLSGTISDEFGNPIRDAAITITNGTTYTTTSDENGAYSQVVNSDTYDIAVSKSRSRFHDTTESSVAVTADTTQDITMPTDKMLGRPTIVNGMSIPGGISMGRSKR